MKASAVARSHRNQLGCGACTLRYKPADHRWPLQPSCTQHEGPERHAIIVIPGILGSRLEDSVDGPGCLGCVQPVTTPSPTSPRVQDSLALPMQQGSVRCPSCGMESSNRPGYLDRIRVRLLGLLVQLKAYFQIIEVLGRGRLSRPDSGACPVRLIGAKTISPASSSLTIFDGTMWKMPSRLHDFILEKQAYIREETQASLRDRCNPDIKFDIVAHSMGSLLTRYLPSVWRTLTCPRTVRCRR